MDPKTPHNVIDLMEEQKSISNLGGTMRLGAYDCVLAPDSKAAEAYGATSVSERHRHRFEFNDDFRTQFESAGMRCVGENPASHLVEVVEIPTLDWFVGTQYHPEYQSTVLNPHPLFVSFMKAAIAHEEKR
jgi:CTP synthase